MGTLTEYEVLLLLDPEAAEERQQEILARTRELVEQGGGSWERHEPWGRRKLAYPIDKKDDGVYHLLLFSAEAETLDEISRILRITDGVMRHLATRRPKRTGRREPSSPAPMESGERREYAAPATTEPDSKERR